MLSWFSLYSVLGAEKLSRSNSIDGRSGLSRLSQATRGGGDAAGRFFSSVQSFSMS